MYRVNLTDWLASKFNGHRDIRELVRAYDAGYHWHTRHSHKSAGTACRAWVKVNRLPCDNVHDMQVRSAFMFGWADAWETAKKRGTHHNG